MKKKKMGKSAARRLVGAIMSVVGAGATVFFLYARSMGLGKIADEAGNVTGGSGYNLLILVSFLLLAKGIQILVFKEKKTGRKKFNLNFPDI